MDDFVKKAMEEAMAGADKMRMSFFGEMLNRADSIRKEYESLTDKVVNNWVGFMHIKGDVEPMHRLMTFLKDDKEAFRVLDLLTLGFFTAGYSAAEDKNKQ